MERIRCNSILALFWPQLIGMQQVQFLAYHWYVHERIVQLSVFISSIVRPDVSHTQLFPKLPS